MNLADVYTAAAAAGVRLGDGYAKVCAALVAALALPERLSVSEWADRHRVLTGKGAAEAGPWRTARTPYLREPMDRLSAHDPATDVVFMAASQVGKSEVGNNWVGYTIDHDPAPMLMVEPTLDTAEKYSKQRIAPMIAASERLSGKVAPARARDSGNTTLVKDFPGGMLILTGSNAASSLASMPIKKLLLDETDRYPADVDDEGDPIALAEQRTITFPRAKRFKASTPGRVTVGYAGEKVLPHIAKEYERGSRAQYWVPCPHCGELQVLHRRHLVWDKAIDPVTGEKHHRPETARYVCQANGCLIDENHKSWMLEEVPGDLTRAHWVHRVPELADTRPSYHINALYAPIGLGRSWAQIAELWLAAAADAAKLQPFINLVDGEPYEDHSERLRGPALEKRAEDWPARTVPPGYVLLTLGVDTQNDRLEATLIGWAEGERKAVLDHLVIPGDPIKPEGTPGSPWDALTEYRHRPLRNGAGVDLQIAMTGIDSGGARTQAVYQYGRRWRNDRVIVTKGSSVPRRPVLGKPSKQDVKNSKGELLKSGIQLWIVGTDTAKDALYARLDADGEIELAAERMVRFCAGLGTEWYEQLVAEVRTEHGAYEKVRQRNEALDCVVGAMAAAHHPLVRVHRLQAADWDYLRRLLEPKTGDLFSTTNTPVSASSTPALDAPAAQAAAAAGSDPRAAAPPGQPTHHDRYWLHAGSNWLGD